MKTSEYIYMAGLRGYCITLGRALQYEISHLVQPMLVSCLSLNSISSPIKGERQKSCPREQRSQVVTCAGAWWLWYCG